MMRSSLLLDHISCRRWRQPVRALTRCRVAGFESRVGAAPRLGDCTAEALRAGSKDFLIKKYSELYELVSLWLIRPDRKPGALYFFAAATRANSSSMTRVKASGGWAPDIILPLMKNA